MAIIGNFTATENGYVGTLQTLAFKAEVISHQRTKTKDNQPDYLLTSQGRDIGAAWVRVGFLSVSIDDPSLPPGSCVLKKLTAENRYTLSFHPHRPGKDAE